MRKKQIEKRKSTIGVIKNRIISGITALLLLTGIMGCTATEENYVLFPEFSSMTLAGENIDASIFKDAEITMVNIWGTFCGPCISEMPDLEELYQELPEGCALVGVLTDVYGDQNLDTANRIVSETGVTYKNIIPDEALYQFLADNITGVPTTLYVDTEGHILGGVVGTRSKEEYLNILQGLLDDSIDISR